MPATAMPTPTPSLPAAKPAKRRSDWRTTELGPEKFCTRCDEWWPADLEFFYSNPRKRGGLFYCCKACYRDWQAANRAGKAVAAQAVAEAS